MKLSARARLTTAALVITSIGLAGAGTLPADASAPATAAKTTTARAAAPPKLVFAISKSGAVKLTHGPSTFRPGRVAFTVKSKSHSATLGFAHLDKDYSFKHFRSDLGKMAKGDMSGLKNAIRHTDFYGGYSVTPDGTMSGTVVLPKRGTYTLYNFGGKLPEQALTLTAKGKPQKRTAPKSDGTIKALDGARWGGSSTLPHRGTLTFRNAATDSPHFLNLVQVKPGTTKKDIDDYFQSGSQDPPDFMIADAGSTEVVSPGQSMTWDYNLPAGTYATLCWFPDPKTGMPHAMMGMTRVIELN
jgi:hypothetical protein